MHEDKIALILGATGGIGSAVAKILVARGWQVRGLTRDPERARAVNNAVEWVAGDAMRPEDVCRAAAGSSLILHAVSPAGYVNWDTLAMPMLEATIAAAKQTGAMILLPGNIYNYGPDAFPLLKPDAPQNPQTPKGRVRVEMERRLEQVSAEGVAVLIVRAGDFIGPAPANSWFRQAMVKAGKPVTAMSHPSASGIGHSWAYVPDLAETMVRLVERRNDLPRFARYHFEGIWDHDGEQLVQATARVTGRTIRRGRVPWMLLKIGGLFSPLLRELVAMRYLWSEPLKLDNSTLVAVLGEEPRTDLDEVVRVTLKSINAL